MIPDDIEKLRQQYTGQYVAAVGERPELLRFRNLVGEVKTVNMSRRALVQFDTGSDRAWYDLAIEDLRVVDKPPPKVEEKKTAAPAKAKSAEKTPAVKPGTET